MCLLGIGMCMHVTVHVCRLADNSFYHVGPGDWTLVDTLDGNYFY